MSGERTLATIDLPRKARTDEQLDHDAELLIAKRLALGLLPYYPDARVVFKHEPGCELASGAGERCDCGVQVCLVAAGH